MPKPPRPSASEVLRHNLLIRGGLPSLIPAFQAYKGLKSTCSLRIGLNQAEESKYEISDPMKSKCPPFVKKFARNLT